jgi:hypothetical protein
MERALQWKLYIDPRLGTGKVASHESVDGAILTEKFLWGY